MCPTDDSTMYPSPRKPEMVLALLGDSTITRRTPVPGLAALLLVAIFFHVLLIYAHSTAPTSAGRPWPAGEAPLVRTVRYVASWRRYRIHRGRRVQDATVCPLFVPMCDRPGKR